jgi:DNA-binding CsgD family transcriptional regulator
MDTARAAAEAAGAEMQAPGSDAGGLGWLGPLEALLLEADGDHAGAFAAVKPVYDLAIDLGVATRAQRLAPQLVRLALAVGDRDLAVTVADGARDRGGPDRPPSFQGAAAHCQGLVDGDGDELLEAADLYREGSPIDFVLSARAAGEVVDGKAGRERARPVLEESLTWCTKLGADLHGHAVSEILDAWAGPASPGARYHDRPVSGWESLTPAEKGVAELVGDGLSNAEIAERLFISRRTVESHVAHVYQKLQIKGRVALAIEVSSQS